MKTLLTKFLDTTKFHLVLIAAVVSSCDKSGNSFSVLAGSSSFQQAATYVPRKLDVLFVIDNSGSMSSSQSNLANNFSSFIDRFISKGYDFKIAITTSDAYYGDQFLNYSTPNNGFPCSLCNLNQARFRSGVTPTPVYVIASENYDLLIPAERNRLKSEFAANVQVGTTGSGDERVFSSFKAALSSPLNTGFRRPDAFLSIVIVSDEEDFSEGVGMPSPTGWSLNESYTNPLLHPVDEYKKFLNGFTSGVSGKDYSVSTISVLDSTCLAALGGGRKIGTRYMQLSQMTGGSQNSLCAAFDTSLDNISTTVAGQVTAIFRLDKKPVVSSIRVIIDGIVIPASISDGWSYDSVKNQITINGSQYVPRSGSSIIINFDPDITGG